MSILKVESIQHPSSPTVNISLNTDGTLAVRSTSSGGLSTTRYSSTSPPSINLIRQVTDTVGGTGGAISGTALGQIRFQGWNTSAESIGASIFVYAEETWSPTSQATSMQFETTTPGSALTFQRIKINSNTSIDFTPGGGYTTGFTYVDVDGTLNQKGTTSGNLGITRYSSSSQPSINLRRSRSDTINTSTGAINTTGLGALNFMAYDAASVYAVGASVSATATETWSATARGSKLSFATVPAAASALTTKMEIGPDGLITGVGPSLGAWTSYTPTIGGTGWAVGNGTLTSNYCQIGKTVFFRIYFITGSTTTYGTTALTWTLPVTAKATTYLAEIFRGMLNSSTSYPLTVYATSTTTMRVMIPSTTGTLLPLIQTTPYTMTTGDGIYVSGSYEAA